MADMTIKERIERIKFDASRAAISRKKCLELVSVDLDAIEAHIEDIERWKECYSAAIDDQAKEYSKLLDENAQQKKVIEVMADFIKEIRIAIKWPERKTVQEIIKEFTKQVEGK